MASLLSCKDTRLDWSWLYRALNLFLLLINYHICKFLKFCGDLTACETLTLDFFFSKIDTVNSIGRIQVNFENEITQNPLQLAIHEIYISTQHWLHLCEVFKVNFWPLNGYFRSCRITVSCDIYVANRSLQVINRDFKYYS